VAAICAGAASDVTAVHDVSGAGLAGALAEMVAVTGRGVEVDQLEGHAELFAECPGRFVVATSRVDEFVARARDAGVPVTPLGTVGGARLRVGDALDLAVSQVAARRAGALEAALARS
jgi:phosphoribosylformylglycinamidine synthase